jgi:hypothetical protein
MLLHPDFVLANVVALPGGMVLVDWAGARRGPHRRRSSLRVGQVAGSVIGRLRSPRHPSPDFSYLLAYLVVDSGLVVDSVRRDAPDTPQNPDPPHQGSLHATTVVPADPPDSTVSPQGRFSWRIGACGRIWGTIVHKVLPQAQMLHNLGARWTVATAIGGIVASTTSRRPRRTLSDLACCTGMHRIGRVAWSFTMNRSTVPFLLLAWPL